VLGQLLFQAGQIAIAQAGRRFQIVQTLGALQLDAHFVNLRFGLADGLDGRLLLLPAGLQRVGFFAQVGQLRFQVVQPLFGRLVALLLERFALDL